MSNVTSGTGASFELPAPKRSDYPNNVGGAISYYFHVFVYGIISSMGRQLSRWAAGIFGDFFKDISGELRSMLGDYYTKLAQNEAYPPEMRKIFATVANPQGEAEAAIAMMIAGVVVSAVMSPVAQALATPLVYWVNNKLNLHRDSPDTLVPMYFRGTVSQATLFDYMNDLGYAEELRAGYIEANRPRITVSDIVTALHRNSMTWDAAASELKKRGYTDQDIVIIKMISSTPLDVSDIFRAYYRSLIDTPTASTLLQSIGYTAYNADMLLKLSENYPGLSDIISMAVREAWNDSVAQKWGYDDDFPSIVADYAKKLGYNPDWAKRYWRAHWELPSVTMGIDMVQREVITQDEFINLLKIADYPSEWRKRIAQVIYQPYTRVDARRMYKLGVLSYDDLVREYKHLGYDEAHARALADFTVKYEDDQGNNKQDQYRNLTVSLLQKAYSKNLISKDEFESRLSDLRYAPDEAKIIVDLTDLSKTVDKAPDPFADYQNDMKALIQRSYSKGFIDKDTAIKALLDINVSQQEAEYLAAVSEYVYAESVHSDEIDLIGKAFTAHAITETEAIERLGKLGLPAREQDMLFEQWKLKLQLGTRRLTDTELKTALSVGAISLDEYKSALEGQEYCEKDIDTIVKVTIASLKPGNVIRLIAIGVISEAEYFSIMRGLGYSDDEISAALGMTTGE